MSSTGYSNKQPPDQPSGAYFSLHDIRGVAWTAPLQVGLRVSLSFHCVALLRWAPMFPATWKGGKETMKGNMGPFRDQA